MPEGAVTARMTTNRGRLVDRVDRVDAAAGTTPKEPVSQAARVARRPMRAVAVHRREESSARCAAIRPPGLRELGPQGGGTFLDMGAGSWYKFNFLLELVG